jgi:hypothetical protein
MLLPVGPPLQDVVPELAHRLDHLLLSDRRLLDLAVRPFDQAQQRLDFRAQLRVPLQPCGQALWAQPPLDLRQPLSHGRLLVISPE